MEEGKAPQASKGSILIACSLIFSTCSHFSPGRVYHCVNGNKVVVFMLGRFKVEDFSQDS